MTPTYSYLYGKKKNFTTLMCIALSHKGHEDDKFYENDSKDPKEIKFWCLRKREEKFQFR